MGADGFLKCKLLFSQGDRKHEVTLERMDGAVAREGFSYWGSFSVENGNIPPEREKWLYALAKWELRLLDAEGPGVGQVGGGLKFGEIAASPPAAILSHARLTERGIEPMNASGIGVGQVQNGSAFVGINSGPISWSLLAFKARGASGWQSP